MGLQLSDYLKIGAVMGTAAGVIYAGYKLVKNITDERRYNYENKLTQDSFQPAYKLLDDYENNLRIMDKNINDNNGSKPIFTPEQAFERAVMDNPIQSDDPAYMFAFKAIETDSKKQNTAAIRAMTILKTWDAHDSMDGEVTLDKLITRMGDGWN